MTIEANILLRQHAAIRVANTRALCDSDLRFDDIDPSHFLGHRMFNLDSRIDLDEVERTTIAIHEELDSTRIAVFGSLGETQGMPAELFSLLRR